MPARATSSAQRPTPHHAASHTPASVPDPRHVRRALLAWFPSHRRDLPGREIREPWRVLVLEVMSQQTQIERCLAARDLFCTRFPSPASLAAASPADAVRAWAGLGYNRRALALRAAAQRIVDCHGDRVPADVAALDELPGIGPYTARAVAARAFGIAAIPVDVNVRRVFGRLLGATDPRMIESFGDAVAEDDGAAPWPGDLADALMDLAAGVCRAKDPGCPDCPLADSCAFLASGLPEGPRPGPARTAAQPFRVTRRWLRGQLLRELRLAPAGTWTTVEGGRGAHGHAAVREALDTLASEGFVEIDGKGRARLAET